MTRRLSQRLISGCTILAVAVAAIYLWSQHDLGKVTDRHKDVPVYDNGPLAYKSHGKHYSPTGYYWGQKWQCVEFVKRFYDQAYGHHMPDVFGHAKGFFDPSVKEGAINTRRGMLQFPNGAGEAPRPDDLLVFDGNYGHVAIVTEVGSNYVEVIQQNIYNKPRARFGLTLTNGSAKIDSRQLLGWLRIPSKPTR